LQIQTSTLVPLAVAALVTSRHRPDCTPVIVPLALTFHRCFDLAVVAAEHGADESAARALIERCSIGRPHIEGDRVGRIVAFYQALRAIYPDDKPHDQDTP
jgi:hypothetical protein